MGCWSCRFYTGTAASPSCALARHVEVRADAGTACRSFDYEPGADEAERHHAHQERGHDDAA